MKYYPTNNPDKPTLIDDYIFEWLSIYDVSLEYHKTGYAVVRGSEFGRARPKLLHRIIMKKYGLLVDNPKDGNFEKDWMEVDHINRDKLDNRKENLRLVTHEENMRNTWIKSEKARRLAIGEITDDFRWCSRCRIHLSPDLFHSGSKFYCKKCMLTKQKEYREKKKQSEK